MAYYPGIFLEGPRKTVKNISEDTGLPSQNLNQGPPKYALGMSLLESVYSVLGL
jgi:hypothetical protein